MKTQETELKLNEPGVLLNTDGLLAHIINYFLFRGLITLILPIDFTKVIRDNKAVIDFRNDDYCFKWALSNM